MDCLGDKLCMLRFEESVKAGFVRPETFMYHRVEETKRERVRIRQTISPMGSNAHLGFTLNQ